MQVVLFGTVAKISAKSTSKNVHVFDICGCISLMSSDNYLSADPGFKAELGSSK